MRPGQRPTLETNPELFVKKGIDPKERQARQAREAAVIRGKRREQLMASKRTLSADPDAVRGITRRDRIAWILFRAFARGDFHHDFGENDPVRDKIMASDENRFFDIAKLVSKKGSVWLRTKFREYVGSNLYKIIADQINAILPPETVLTGGAAVDEGVIQSQGVDLGQFAKEETLLKFVGLEWDALKKEIVSKDPGVVIEKTFETATINRTYEIRACPYRKSLDRTDRENYKTNRAPIETLQTVTGGKKNFACIIDASGGFPFSDLRDRTLLSGDANDCTVYIIENIENSSDSATKILAPPILPKKGGEGLPAPPNLVILRDRESTVNYPLWKRDENQYDPKTNIYSTLHIVLNRSANDVVEANLLVLDAAGNRTESYSIGDVSNMSNVKNATLYALATILEKGSITNDALIYTLIKRMGDWCQALSLLDIDRLYDIDEIGMAAGAAGRTEVTLRQLQAEEVEVGVVTNDRILLAFCILLGLNVYYTSAMDIARLIYFKNTMDTPSPQVLKDKFLGILNMYGGVEGIRSRVAPIDAHIQGIKDRRDVFIRDTLNTADLAGYVYHLRNLLSNFRRLRIDFAVVRGQIEERIGILGSEDADGREKLAAMNSIVSLLAKIDVDTQYNETVLADITAGVYPNSTFEKPRLTALRARLEAGGRATTSVEVAEAKNFLLATRDDILQIQDKSENLLAGVNVFRTAESFLSPLPATADSRATIARDRLKTNYEEVLSSLKALQILIRPPPSGGQRGGTPEDDVADIIQAWDALTTRNIRIIQSPATAPIQEITSTVNIYRLGGVYTDLSLKSYTVVNEYIITEDDLPVFNMVFSKPLPDLLAIADETVLDMLTKICKRYLLLQTDMAMNDINQLMEDAVPEHYESLLTPEAITKRLENDRQTIIYQFGEDEEGERRAEELTEESTMKLVVSEIEEEVYSRQREGTVIYERYMFLNDIRHFVDDAIMGSDDPIYLIRTTHAMHSYILGIDEEEEEAAASSSSALLVEEPDEEAAAASSSSALLATEGDGEAAGDGEAELTDEEKIRDLATSFLVDLRNDIDTTQNGLYSVIINDTIAVSAVAEDAILAERADTAAREASIKATLTTAIQDVMIVDNIAVRIAPAYGIPRPDPASVSSTPVDPTIFQGFGTAIRAAVLAFVSETIDPELGGPITAPQILRLPGLAETIAYAAANWAYQNDYIDDIFNNSGVLANIRTYIGGIRTGGSLEGGDATTSNVETPYGGVLPGGRRRLYEGLRKRSG
jgi:hypothetical protein